MPGLPSVPRVDLDFVGRDTFEQGEDVPHPTPSPIAGTRRVEACHAGNHRPGTCRLAALIPLAAAVLAALLLAPAVAHAQRRAPGAGAGDGGQPVQLPYVMRDTVGVSWDIQMDASCGDGGNDLYDGGGRLDVNGMVYQSPTPQARFDAANNELTFTPATLGGLTLTRRVAVNAAGGWCRWTEVLENAGNAPVRTTVHVHWDLGSTNMQNRSIEDDKGKGLLLGQAIFDGQRGLAMLCAGRGAKVSSRYQMQQGSDQIEQYYDVEVPAKKSIALAHFQAMRPGIDAAAAFITQTKEKELLDGMPKEIRRILVNFKRSEGLMVGDVELPRAEMLDTVELKTGDQYRGQLKDPTFKLDTFHGPVELPVDRVIGMVTVGTVRPRQVFVTTDGELVGGKLIGSAPAAGTGPTNAGGDGAGNGGDGSATPAASSPTGGGLRFELSSGQVVVLPLTAIAKVGCRKRPGEPEEWRFDKPMAYLRDGQRIAVDAPAGPLLASTLFGPVELKPEWVSSLVFQGEEQAIHQIRLKDGSRFNALFDGGALPMKLRGASVPSSAGVAALVGGQIVSPGNAADPVAFPLAALTRVQLAPTVGAGEEAPVDLSESPTMTLANGDLLVGQVSGVLEVETGFDVLRLNGPEVRAIRRADPPEGQRSAPAEVTVTMWDGATMSGRLKGDAVAFAPASGGPRPIPVLLLARYAHPNPVPPPAMVEKIRGVVSELGSPDFKTRERAAGQLRAIGQGVAGVLKAARDQQPAEAQKIIDTILKSVAQEKAEEAKKAAQAAGGAGAGGNAGGGMANQPGFQPGFQMQQAVEFHGGMIDR